MREMLIEWLKLKEISRQGWVLKGVESPDRLRLTPGQWRY